MILYIVQGHLGNVKKNDTILKSIWNLYLFLLLATHIFKHDIKNNNDNIIIAAPNMYT